MRKNRLFIVMLAAAVFLLSEISVYAQPKGGADSSSEVADNRKAVSDAIEITILQEQQAALVPTGKISPSRRQALREQVQWIAELAERTIESPRDRVRFESWLVHVRETLVGS